MNKILCILKGIGIGFLIVFIVEYSVKILNLTAIHLNLYNHDDLLVHIYGRSYIKMNIEFTKSIFIMSYAIGFEFLTRRGKFRFVFTITCLVLYFVGIIYGGIFSKLVHTEIMVQVLIYPLIAFFTRELIHRMLQLKVRSSVNKALNKDQLLKDDISQRIA